MKQSKRVFFVVALCCAMIFALGVVNAQAEEAAKVEKIAFPASKLTLGLDAGFNDTASLALSIEPEGVQTQITYASSNARVASVDEYGVVTAHIQGSAIITASTADGHRARCTVTVKKVVPVESVKLSASQKTLYVGSDGAVDTLQLESAIYPSTAQANKSNAKSARWQSSNTRVARVDQEGLVTPVKAGACTIRYQVRDGSKTKQATCRITVKSVAPKSVTLSQDTASIMVGSSVQLSASVLPENALGSKVTWKSSNAKVASVSANGLVSAKAPGTAKIVCTTASGKCKAVCQVTVGYEFTGVKYRLFAVGNSAYQGDGKLPGCKNDLAVIRRAYQNASFSGEPCRVYAKENLTGAQIRKLLSAMSTQYSITENDVTVFYYSGHGMEGEGYNGALCGVNWDLVTVDEVQKLLDRVPGKVIVILDCCLSGQYISSKSAMTGDAAAFASGVINAFSKSTATNYNARALTDSENKSKYKIITACAPREYSYISEERNNSMSVFTDYVALAMGEDLNAGGLLKMKGDANGDSVVTLHELYTYVNAKVKSYVKRNPAYKQTTMVWPQNDNFAVIARN